MAQAGQTGADQEAAANETNLLYKEEFFTVEKDVKLQVFDWGGKGRAMILLAALGFNAHEWDSFAPKLVPKYHVYAITRRGFGASSAPKPNCENYAADRLGDDVLEVMDALKPDRPIVVGHSIAGEELSSIGTRYYNRVAGLIYLDAGYRYAYYNEHAAHGDWLLETFAMQRELDKYGSPGPPREKKLQLEHLLKISLPRYQQTLEQREKEMGNIPDGAPGPPNTPEVQINAPILRGFQVYGGVHCPVLAVFADPHGPPPNTPADPQRAVMVSEDHTRTSEQVDAFQAGNPFATVIRIPNGSHLVFRSNEAEVLRAMDTFASGLQ